MGDCTIGKELKQSTCRYVKKCKPGWVRNDKYICRKTLRRTGKHANSQEKNMLNSPNENNFGVLRNTLRTPNISKLRRDKLERDRRASIKQMFGTPSPSPNEKIKLTNKELGKLFESPNEIFNDEPSNSSPKVPKKTKKLITGKVRQLLLKPKSRKNFRELINSPNEPFDLKKQKQLAYARLRKTKDLKLRERIKAKEREAMTRHAQKIAKKYNVVQNSV